MRIRAHARRLALLLPPLRRRHIFLRELGAERNRLTELVHSLEAERERASRLLQEQSERENLSAYEHEHQRRLAQGAQRELDVVRGELAETEARLAAAESRVAELSAAHDRSLLQLAGNRRRLQAAVSSGGVLAHEAERLKAGLERAQADLDRSRADLAEALERQREFELRMHNYDSALAAAEAAATRADAALQQESSRSRALAEDLRSREAELAQLQETQARNAGLSAELADLHTRWAVLEHEADRARTELSTVRAQADELRVRVGWAEAQMELGHERLAELASARAEAAGLRQRIGALESQLMAARESAPALGHAADPTGAAGPKISEAPAAAVAVAPSRNVVFIHVPKTAGFSLTNTFIEAYGKTRTFSADSAFALPAFAAHLTPPFFLSGHFTLEDVVSTLGIDIDRSVNIAMVRDPVERVRSLHAYMTKYPRSHELFSLSVAGKSLKYFLDYALDKHPEFITDTQCRQLGGTGSFEVILPKLRKNFNCIGTSERIREVVDEVSMATGIVWSGPPPVRHLNSAERAGPINEADRERILSANTEDQKLYDYVLQQGGLLINRERSSLE